MSSGFRTELPTMQAAAQHVEQVNVSIQAQLSQLLSRLEPLAGTWQSGAAASFQTLKQRWHDEATKLNAVLREIGEGLARAQQTYQASDTTNAEGFDRQTSGL
jgi:early secretory antigenic target protein ESAT-6